MLDFALATPDSSQPRNGTSTHTHGALTFDSAHRAAVVGLGIRHAPVAGVAFYGSDNAVFSGHVTGPPPLGRQFPPLSPHFPVDLMWWLKISCVFFHTNVVQYGECC